MRLMVNKNRIKITHIINEGSIAFLDLFLYA